MLLIIVAHRYKINEMVEKYKPLYRPAHSFLVLFLLTCFTSAVLAQTNNSENDNGNSGIPASQFQINLPSSLNQGIYIDAYGLELLKQNMLGEAFRNLENYSLAPNDLLSIEFSGNVSSIMRGITVNAQGNIILPNIGAINVKGMTLTDAQKKLQQVVNNKLQNTTAILTLDRPRNIHIHVNGPVPFPGNYQMPAQTRLNNAIIPALTDGKNPRLTASSRNQEERQRLDAEFLRNNNLSLRNIEILRSDGSTEVADLVSYYRSGNLVDNPFVQDGDVIRIKTISPHSPDISISGAVRNELQLEYNPADTPHALIMMAGGLRYDAVKDYVLVYRQSREGLQKTEVSDEQLTTYQLEPFDRVVVPVNRARQQSGTAIVKGEVQMPGNYPIQDGKTSVLELLEMAGGLNNRALTQAAFLVRNTNEADTDGRN